MDTIFSKSQLHSPGRIPAPAVLGRGRLAEGEWTDAARLGLVGRTVADVERDLILDTLDHCLGNRTRAAGILGISIRTLRNKLADYIGAGIEVAEPGGTRPARPPEPNAGCPPRAPGM